MVKVDPIVIIFRALTGGFALWLANYMGRNVHWFSESGVMTFSTVLGATALFFGLSFIKRKWSYWSVGAFCFCFPLLVLITGRLLVFRGGDLIENLLVWSALMALPGCFAWAFFKMGREIERTV